MALTSKTAKNAICALLAALALSLSFQFSLPGHAHAEDEQAPDIIAAEADPAPEATIDTSGEQPIVQPLGVRYSIKAQRSGWTPEKADYKIAGKPKGGARLTSLKVEIGTGTSTGSVRYRAYLANGKWTKWKKDGAAIGSHNNIEAIQVKLTGEISNTHDIVYRAYVDTVGWQRRMRNGESAGVVGKGLRIEAVRVKLMKKTKRAGWVGDAGSWSFYKAGKPVAGTWVDTAESPIDPGLSGKHRYWLDGQGALAVSRYVLPSNADDAAAGYAAYATDAGYVFCGKRSAPEGITLSDATGKLYTKTRWLKTSEFDGGVQRYRLEKAGDYAVVKTGLFEVNGKKYYGFEDERGYLMRSTTRWAGDAWYKASASGVLKNVDKQTKKHIERYVKWAVAIANDDSHGYSQANRWGPDYDCSSLVVSALDAAGFPDSGALWTGNMLECLTNIGFVWHTDLSQLKRGDIMLVHADYRQHTEIYLGKNKLVGAHIAETGGVYGVAGDQTGNEIGIARYYNAPWQGFLRYRS